MFPNKKKVFSHIKQSIFFIIFLFISLPSFSAGVSLNATRLVYDQGSKSISVHARNNTDINFLSKFSVTDSRNIPSSLFNISPPLIKILKGKSQEIRIYADTSSLPADRETVFYLHAVMIPAVSSGTQSNALSIAYENIIKIFYRPANLTMLPEEAYRQLTIKATSSGVTVMNNSPYYISLSRLILNGTKVDLDMAQKNTMIPPFDSLSYTVPVNARKGTAEWTAINDLGGDNEFSTQIH
ncbi:molecular chaperone [Morganella psychrotolerans]|uniref:fimbrial biogenesis chaperone n=1 Tax=Morganella psychrotolerans TaxID=368603 RepID=UPI0039B00517